jgi:hypothetical protein
VCVCLCLRERERERETKSDKSGWQRERQRVARVTGREREKETKSDERCWKRKKESEREREREIVNMARNLHTHPYIHSCCFFITSSERLCAKLDWNSPKEQNGRIH